MRVEKSDLYLISGDNPRYHHPCFFVIKTRFEYQFQAVQGVAYDVNNAAGRGGQLQHFGIEILRLVFVGVGVCFHFVSYTWFGTDNLSIIGRFCDILLRLIIGKEAIKTINNMKRAIKLFLIVLIFGSCSKEVPSSPVARFEVSQKYAAGAQYLFINQSTDAQSFKWTFGDGGISSEKNPMYVFKKNGKYEVRLEATGKGGTNQYTQIIELTNIPTTGRMLFWTRINDAGNINVSVEGAEAGKITKPRTDINSSLLCDTEGYVTITLPEGNYTYTAKSQGAIPVVWSGTFQIVNGICMNKELSK